MTSPRLRRPEYNRRRAPKEPRDRAVQRMKPSIRLAELADAEALCDLNAEVHEYHLANRPDQFRALERDEIAQWFRQLLSSPTSKIWLAELDSVAIGSAVVTVQSRAQNPFCPARSWWELDQIGVRASQRGRGVGRALVETVLREARAFGAHEVELCTWAFNQSAQKAFVRFGFTPKVIRYQLRLRNP